MPAQIDIVIPVYNEGPNILATLKALARNVKTPARVLICYDLDEDDTLPAVRNNPNVWAGLDVEFVRNSNRGAHGAVMAGLPARFAPDAWGCSAGDAFYPRVFSPKATPVCEG